MRLENNSFGSGFLTSSNIDANPYTVGVANLSYNFTNTISGGTPLVRTIDGAGVVIAYEAFEIIPEPASGLLSIFGLGVFTLGRSKLLS